MNWDQPTLQEQIRLDWDEPTWSEQIDRKVNRCRFLGKGFSWRHFGGGTKTESVDPYAGLRVRDTAESLYRNLLGPQIGQAGPTYPGQVVPGVSPLQQAGFDVAGGLPPIASGGMQFGANMAAGLDPGGPGRIAAGAESALGDILSPMDAGAARDYWQTSFVDPAMKNLTDRILPTVAERYAGAGTHGAVSGGGFDRAIGRATGNVATGLNAQLGQILFGADQAARNRQLGGVNAATNAALLPSRIAGAGEIMGSNALSRLFGIGGMQRGLAGEQLGEQYQKWESAQPYANPYLNFLGASLGQPGNTIVGQQQGPGAAALLGPLGMYLGSEGGSATFGSLLGGAGGAASGLYGAGAGALGAGAGAVGGAASGIGSALYGLAAMI